MCGAPAFGVVGPVKGKGAMCGPPAGPPATMLQTCFEGWSTDRMSCMEFTERRVSYENEHGRTRGEGLEAESAQQGLTGSRNDAWRRSRSRRSQTGGAQHEPCASAAANS